MLQPNVLAILGQGKEAAVQTAACIVSADPLGSYYVWCLAGAGMRLRRLWMDGCMATHAGSHAYTNGPASGPRLAVHARTYAMWHRPHALQCARAWRAGEDGDGGGGVSGALLERLAALYDALALHAPRAQALPLCPALGWSVGG